MKYKNIVYLVILVLASLALGGLVGYVLQPEPTVVEKPVIVEKNMTVEVVKEVPVEVLKEVEKIVTVDKIVTVEDESFKQLACDRLLFDDMKECVQEVKAEDAALALAIAEIKAEFAEELEDANLVEDERDAKIVKIYSAFEDLQVTESDYDDSEYEFVVKVKVNDEEAEDKFYANFTVEVVDGEAKITDVV